MRKFCKNQLWAAELWQFDGLKLGVCRLEIGGFVGWGLEGWRLDAVGLLVGSYGLLVGGLSVPSERTDSPLRAESPHLTDRKSVACFWV